MIKYILTIVLICVIFVIGLPIAIYYYLNKEYNIGTLKKFLERISLEWRK